MKTFFVFVTFKPEGIQRVRYIDSQWVDEGHALTRKDELADSLTMFDAPSYVITIKQGMVADAAVKDDVTPEVAE